MVETPWGSSESLRERRLPPGRATPPAEVARNQRERLFAATVAVVAEKGYEAANVADLLALSGISRASFYEHFDGKEKCFVATVEALVEPALAAVARAAEEEERRPVRAAVETFAALLEAQPAAAQLCFVEVHCAGPEAVAAVERAFEAFVALAAEALEDLPGHQGTPGELVRAIVGGFWQLAHRRLCRGETEGLRALVPAMIEWGLCYAPPPQQLRRSTRRTPLARGGGGAHYEEAERILRAFAAVVCECGYTDTTLAGVAERASCSLTTFHSHFAGKEGAMAAALDSGSAQMLAAVLPAFRRGVDWPHSVRAAFRAMLAFGAAEPDYARLGIVEVFAAGRGALVRREEVLAQLEALLSPGFELAPSTPPIAAEAVGGAIYALMYEQVRERGPERLPELEALATYVALCPFIGGEEAAAIANKRR